MASDPITQRLPADNYTVNLCAGHNAETGAEIAYDVEIALARHPVTGAVHEIAFTNAGKIGSSLDLMFHDLSIALSRILQARDPRSGEPTS